MAYPNEGHEEPMSAAEASMYVRSMIHLEANGPGDCERAMERLEAKYKIGFWTLDHLRKMKAKTCDVSLFARIRAAYIAVCESQIKKLEQQIALEKAMGTDDHLEDLARQASDLAALVQAKKQMRASK
jgi:hypothetical protein